MWSCIEKIMLNLDIVANTLILHQEVDQTYDLDKLLQFMARFESIIDSVEFYDCSLELIEFIGNLHPEWRVKGC